MYERFFGLADAPFRLTPDPRYLYLSPKHAEVLAHLKLGLRESSGFVCITGDVGTGKTTLVRAFLAEVGPEFATAYVFNPMLSALELVQTISTELGLPGKTRSAKVLIDALNRHLLAEGAAGRRALVVIDEAQALSIDVLEQLRLLSNLETATEKLLRIVLIGQPQLRALLLHPELVQLNQRITLRWHMGPLSRRETTAYIRHRLDVASGNRAPRIFTAAAIRLVHRHAAGIPRLINMIAHRAMLAAFAADRRVVRARFVRQAHREIGALPLPVVARPRRTTWAAAGATACLAAVAGVTWSVGWSPPRPAPVEEPPAVAEGSAPEPEPDVETMPAEAGEPVAAAPVPPTPMMMVARVEPGPEPTPALPEAEVERRLLRLDAQASAREAVTAMLTAWHVSPLGPDESVSLAALAPTVQRRGLEHLPLVGNVSMLRLLDLPAILELRLPASEGTRWVAVTAMDDGHVTLSLDGAAVTVDEALLARHWFGQAHVLWRDFEALGPTFGMQARGAQVTRLQGLLRRAGAYDGSATGVYDVPTQRAVLDFQRSRLLDPDGRVGRFTRIVLYGAAGGYARPTLARTADGAPS